MAHSLRQRWIFAGLRVAAFAGGGLLSPAQTIAEEKLRCTCSDGRSLETGLVSYNRNSHYETIIRIEVDGNSPQSRCTAIWIESTEIHPRGTPYQFHLERMTLRGQPFYACNYSTDRFVKRAKTYAFVFNSNSFSIDEMRLNPKESIHEPDLHSKSNATLWDSITAESPIDARGDRKLTSQINPYPEFNRTSWVLARKAIKAHYVGVVKDIDQSQRLVPLKRTRKVKAGQLGQIEATNAGRAIVRFYQGGRIEKFARTRNALRRWYDNVGGPYKKTKDDLYTPLGAYIVEVFLDDIIEVNDYLNQTQTDRT